MVYNLLGVDDRSNLLSNTSVNIIIYSRRQYKVSVPLKKTRCPTAYQR